jgi:hypothetical protein
MIFLDTFFLMLGLGVLCRVFFMSLVYALPTAVGLTTLFTAYNFIGSVIAASLIAIAAGTLTLRAGQYTFATVRALLLRFAIKILFAIPAAIVGYNATLDFAPAPSDMWSHVFAIFGALSVGVRAYVRMNASSNDPQPQHIVSTTGG